jgi:hypothetical protein
MINHKRHISLHTTVQTKKPSVRTSLGASIVEEAELNADDFEEYPYG